MAEQVELQDHLEYRHACPYSTSGPGADADGLRCLRINEQMASEAPVISCCSNNDSPLIRICFVDGLQIQEIVGFVSNIIQAKNT